MRHVISVQLKLSSNQQTISKYQENVKVFVGKL